MTSTKYIEPIDFETNPKFQIEYIVALLGLEKITKTIPRNGRILYRCPFCGDSSNNSHGHLYINLMDNSYYCVKCGEGGKALSLYAKLNNIDNAEAITELSQENEMNEQRKKDLKNIKDIKKYIEKNTIKEDNPLADIAIRDAVYRELLNHLTLSDKHKENLLKRGLSESFIREMNYKSILLDVNDRNKIATALINKGYNLDGIPGFYKDKKYNNWTFKGGYDGFFIPVYNCKKQIQAFQIRRSVSKNKYIWFSSNGEISGTPAKTFIDFTSLDMTKPFVIVEGTLKSQVCSYLRSSANYIGIPGTFATKFLVSSLNNLGIKNVFIAFDMDKLTNPYVLKAENSLKKLLYENNISYNIFNWDINKGKGLDDFLLTINQPQNQISYEDDFVFCG